MSETPKTGFVASRPSHVALIFELKRGDAMTRTANVQKQVCMAWNFRQLTHIVSMCS